MTLFVVLLILIAAYYAAHGGKFLSLARIAEPAFAVNVAFLVNFPGRALALLLFPDALESAPTLVWDLGTCNAVLMYATACLVVFNLIYEHFLGQGSAGAVLAGSALPPLQRIPGPALVYFAVLAGVVVYFMLTSRTNVNFVHDLGVSDIPQIVYLFQFALDATIIGSLIMLLLTRQPVYLAAFALFFGSFLHFSFLLTAKYALVGYLVIILLVLTRCGFAIRPRHFALVLLVAAPYLIGSYVVRDFDLGEIAPENTVVDRLALILTLLEKFSLDEALTNFFLVKLTDRFLYLETFMVYLQALGQNVTLDLYDKLGSLPTYKIAIPSLFGVDKSDVQNIHVWFGNKYWYGLSSDYYNVVIPFGRVTESFMIFGWSGFLFFAFYGWLFAWLYRRLFCSTDPLLVIYYLLLYYYYILVDDVLLFNISTIVYGTAFFFASVVLLRMLPQGRSSVPT